jgi:uncharacterized protein (DUF2252 family)
MKAKKSAGFPRVEDRQTVLRETRNLKMAGSAHAYMRGNTAKFYEWLEAAKGTLPKGPPIWICGDCHVGNLGPIADADDTIGIQIRDFDQTVIGNPAHDLIRLGLSLATAARGSDLPGVTTAKMIEQLVEGYEEALAGEDNEGDSRGSRPEVVQIVMKRAVGRKWADLAKERIEDTHPTIPLGKRFWPLTRTEKAAIAELFDGAEVRRLVTSLRSRKSDAGVEVLDAAYWVKGCSSLGRLRYAVLLGVGKDHSKEGSLCLMDIKEAVQAAAPCHARAKMPRAYAARVVEGARHLSPALGDRMLPARLLERGVVLRELRPQDLKLEIDRLTREEAMKAARFLAVVVGQAHARQLDAQGRRKWRDELSRERSTSLDAPSWLWSSVVELMGSHEAAYLEHCRRYAIDPGMG